VKLSAEKQKRPRYSRARPAPNQLLPVPGIARIEFKAREIVGRVPRPVYNALAVCDGRGAAGGVVDEAAGAAVVVDGALGCITGGFLFATVESEGGFVRGGGGEGEMHDRAVGVGEGLERGLVDGGMVAVGAGCAFGGGYCGSIGQKWEQS
jgi:hypothetical protein